MAEIIVEFFGIPRRRAGVARANLTAATVAQALTEIQRRYTQLQDLQDPDGKLNPHYLLSVDGRMFVADSHLTLEPQSRLLLMSADAGG